MPIEDGGRSGSIELAVSDPSQLAVLGRWLQGAVGVEVGMEPGIAGRGELGVLDVLTVLAGSSGLVAAVKTLPEFIRSRRTGFHLEMTVRGEAFTLDATNVEELLPIVERLLSE